LPSSAVKKALDVKTSKLTASSIRIYKSGNNKKIKLKNNVPNEVPRNTYLITTKFSMSYENKLPYSLNQSKKNNKRNLVFVNQTA
jgi:hypothetical protein